MRVKAWPLPGSHTRVDNDARLIGDDNFMPFLTSFMPYVAMGINPEKRRPRLAALVW